MDGTTPVEDPVLTIPLNQVRPAQLANGNRFHRLDRQESYFRKQQDEHKGYDWAGYFYGYGAQSLVRPGYYVPYSQRRPAARYDLATIAVRRFTALLFGAERFPKISIPDDENADRFLRALLKAANVPVRSIEWRNLGGAIGSVGLSYGFVDGQPRVNIHNAKHLTVLDWADAETWTPRAVLKTYSYPRDVWDPATKKVVTTTLYYVRYWDENVDVLWEPMTQKVAEEANWRAAPHRTVVHRMGRCPVIWVQNIHDSENADGEGDYEGLEPNLDEINQLLSSGSAGVKANNDPTLVVHAPPKQNTGALKKGSENAIFSEGGASYLELSGTASAATLATAEGLRAATLDAMSVVIADPEKLSGAAQSAAALRILYAPMLAAADERRATYGAALVTLCKELLRGARMILGTKTIDDEGREFAGTVQLGPEFEKNEDGSVTPVKLEPGKSEAVELNWSPYFSPTWTDIQAATTATQAACGSKSIISQRTAVAAVSELFGVTDVDAELKAIGEDEEASLERAQRAMEEGGPVPPGTKDDEEEPPSTDE